jgi:hypothetical protein
MVETGIIGRFEIEAAIHWGFWFIAAPSAAGYATWLIRPSMRRDRFGGT